MQFDNLDNRGELQDLQRRVEALERGTPTNNASIGRNGLRVYDGGVVTIENGGLSITGSAEVIGQLIGSGILAWMGDAAFTGDVDMIGTTTISGPLNVIGPVDITDDLDMTGDMTVSGGGKINVGNMKIGEGTHGDGKGVSFTNGGALSATGNRVELYAASNGLISAGTSESAIYLGANGVIVNSDGVKLSGLALNAAPTPNVHIDGTGRLWRTS